MKYILEEDCSREGKTSINKKGNEKSSEIWYTFYVSLLLIFGELQASQILVSIHYSSSWIALIQPLHFNI